MKYVKPALTRDKQIELLERRGMDCSNRALVEHSLKHISYYRLRAYWMPYEVPAVDEGDHAFREATKFEDVLALYEFDRHLRLLLIDAIERIEVSFRTSWSQTMALRHGPHGYLQTNLHDQRQHSYLLDILQEEISRSKDTFIKHYTSKYTEPVDPPIWMVSELLSLGQLSKWYKALKPRADQKAIAKPYGLDDRVLGSFLHHLTHIRNICAHHGRLWNRQFTVTLRLPKTPTDLSINFNQDKYAQRRVYNTLVLVNRLMCIISPNSEWKQHLVSLIEDTPQVKPHVMGFPENWRNLMIWA
ncbi:Abi family protein [Polycladidibacter stylochi]|uniref:Abi family protein n=1 Tax=Polycladidibacter stylochi TaxID=1807766 RepID=UPI00082DBDBB|nr:Abi family protein [Pseudovibrio stylochi]